MTRPLSVDDVHRMLADRVRSGVFPIGSKLPSVRSMAGEFGSNPSTVDRALHRLAQSGIVRTVPRQGTYVSAMDVQSAGGGQTRTDALEKVLLGLRASGMSASEAREAIDRALEVVFSDPTIVFLECNLIDLEQMAQTVTNATGVDLVRVLLDDAPADLHERYDVIAVPLFHIADLTGSARDFSKVVELNFRPSSKALRRLATLDPASRVVVSAPTDRGIERMSSLTRQFFPGKVDSHHSLNDAPGMLGTYDGVVYTNAAQLSEASLAGVPFPILIEWELDPASSSSFLERVAAASAS